MALSSFVFLRGRWRMVRDLAAAHDVQQARHGAATPRPMTTRGARRPFNVRMPLSTNRRAILPSLAAALLLTPVAAHGQYLTRPALPWETIETTNFRVHFPAELRTWVLPVAGRMESYASAVHTLVGSKPESKVTVMVEDPSNISNGFALPLLEGPVIFLWPTPPSPAPWFGQHGGWGEILAIHEYGHIAHLTIPSRNPSERFIWRLLPTQVGPVARKSPPWVIEGYATWLEGRLTGNGRPNSAGRAAVLRQWAIEGQLPTYAQLNATSPFLGGSMRYLVGSAFLEWLTERKGDESLTHLWRRMSARVRRSFGEAFQGVYGAAPDDLYGAFYAEVMEKALDAHRQLRTAGVVEGELVQKRTRLTGDPALSHDGAQVALVLRAQNQPSRIVVWRTTAEGRDSTTIRARQRMLERDPLDVAPFDSFPPPKRAVKTLRPVGGRGHDHPRWFADARRILVSRDEPLGDGAFRPDLFIWDTERGDMRRVTRGAGIRMADPSPDGRGAAAVRCLAGSCDLVRAELATGALTVLAAGSPEVTWHRPRWSPDGRQIAASVQRDGRWQVAVVDPHTGSASASGAPRSFRVIDPGDGASRHSPAWTRDGKLVVVSERGGVANLELLDLETAGPQTLTQVTGAVAAPDASGGDDVWFLALHAKGYDVRRLSLRTPPRVAELTLPPQLFPAAPRPPATPGDSFPVQEVHGPVDYALGPRGWRVLPGTSLGPDGDMVSLMVANVDPVGRFNVVAQGGYAGRGGWRGGSLAAALRTFPVQVEGSAWLTWQSPSRQAAGALGAPAIDARLAGGGLMARVDRHHGAWGYTVRTGASAGEVHGDQLDAAGRVLAVADGRVYRSWTWRGATIVPHLSGHVAQGGTGGDQWRRSLAGGRLSLGTARQRLHADGVYGRATAARDGEAGRHFEQFVVGGAPVPFFDGAFLSQRVALPNVPVGYASGERMGMVRVSATGPLVDPYATWVAAGASLDRFQRVVGVERSIEVPAIGFARLAATQVRFGVGYSLDEPYRKKVRPYVSVTHRP